MRDFLDVFIDAVKFGTVINWKNPEHYNGYAVLWDDYAVTTNDNPSMWALQFQHDAVLQRNDSMIDGVCLQHNSDDTVTISPVTWFQHCGDATIWKDEMEYTKIWDVADGTFIN